MPSESFQTASVRYSGMHKKVMRRVGWVANPTFQTARGLFGFWGRGQASCVRLRFVLTKLIVPTLAEIERLSLATLEAV